MPDLISPAVRAIQKEAEENPDLFWSREAEKVHWFRRWNQVLEARVPDFKWFVGGLTNLSYNCLDRHVQEGWGGHAALIALNELGQRQVYTYHQLFTEVKKTAAALRGIGVKRGDRVAIYMPTMPEAIISMLAATRIGAVHLVVFAGFGASALADRIRMAGAGVLLTADATWRRGRPTPLLGIVEEALRDPSSPVKKVVVLQRLTEKPQLQSGRDTTWQEFLDSGQGLSTDFEQMEANEPAFILPTSGTTAKPKLVVHMHGGYQVWIRSAGEWIFGLKPSDVWWSTSDIGWIVGHSYIVYAPLLFGSTTVAYEGALDHPGPETFYRVVEDNGITGVFTSPTAVRLLMRYGTEAARRFDLRTVQRVFSAGEVLNPPAWAWMQKELFGDRIPVIDHMWQTETGGPVFGNPYGICLLPIKPGSACLPLPGISVEIRNPDGSSADKEDKGIVVITRPFPGLTSTIWGDHERYKGEYWERIPGVFFTGDSAHVDEDGYIWFAGRSDEIIKVADHRIGVIEVESAFLWHPAVAEAGVTTHPDKLRGSVIVAFVTLKAGHSPSDQLKSELRETVRKEFGPLAVIEEINFVEVLPKTRSGKIMRRVLKAIVLNQEPGDISTIESGESVEEARQAWQQMQSQLQSRSSGPGQDGT
jgi:acetyl-CoA synthetase